MSDERDSLAARTGRAVFDLARTVGGIALLAGRLARRMVPPRVDGPELARNLHRAGVRSLPIVGVTARFSRARSW